MPWHTGYTGFTHLNTTGCTWEKAATPVGKEALTRHPNHDLICVIAVVSVPMIAMADQFQFVMSVILARVAIPNKNQRSRAGLLGSNSQRRKLYPLGASCGLEVLGMRYTTRLGSMSKTQGGLSLSTKDLNTIYDH
jgi:hypothetical protein